MKHDEVLWEGGYNELILVTGRGGAGQQQLYWADESGSVGVPSDILVERNGGEDEDQGEGDTNRCNMLL